MRYGFFCVLDKIGVSVAVVGLDNSCFNSLIVLSDGSWVIGGYGGGFMTS